MLYTLVKLFSYYHLLLASRSNHSQFMLIMFGQKEKIYTHTHIQKISALIYLHFSTYIQWVRALSHFSLTCVKGRMSWRDILYIMTRWNSTAIVGSKLWLVHIYTVYATSLRNFFSSDIYTLNLLWSEEIKQTPLLHLITYLHFSQVNRLSSVALTM